MSFPTLRFGREITGDLEPAERREWLVTNGIGGYASGTVAGSLTRRYHGYLVAAITPPLGRTLLLSRLEDTVTYDGTSYELSTNHWTTGTLAPAGYRYVENFVLEGLIPTWTYACADALIEKRVWMERGANTTYVRYVYVRGGSPVRLNCRALVDYRGYHDTTHGYDPHARAQAVERGFSWRASDQAATLYVRAQGATCTLADEWYYGFALPREAERGLDDTDDHLHAATFETQLTPGQDITFVASTEADAPLVGGQALERRRTYEAQLLTRFRTTYAGITSRYVAPANGTAINGNGPANGSKNTYGQPSPGAPAWIEHLALAADQFVVDRSTPSEPDGKTIIAGYHWFGDWGRDTMISLPGLTLDLGDSATAAKILRTFAQFVSEGMLPNRFPDAGETPEYNTADATLWYFEAIRACYAASQDAQLLKDLFPVLAGIIDAHVKGTRFGIGVDPNDGLLRAGVPGVQLTWMDAKVGNWVVTPRIGKPVEINALWFNAVRTMETFAPLVGADPRPYTLLAKKASMNFDRFWNVHAGYCFDVIDGPKGNDPALRPNQLFLLSLHFRPYDRARELAILEACSRVLLTSYGLRSLSPRDPAYIGTYGGDQAKRDGAYHQGTTWGWLLGPFTIAYLRTRGDVAGARKLLAPFEDHLRDYGLGSIAEIFDGDAPFTPRGCIAQAWSVAECLRAFMRVTAAEAAERVASPEPPAPAERH